MDSFGEVEAAVESGGPAAAFELLARKFRDEKNYAGLFEVRLMQKRHELGLPLLQSKPLSDLPPEIEKPYEAAFIEAARETGALFLAAGDIARAWPYFRAIGEKGPVAEALERVAMPQTQEPSDELDRIINVAYFEQVHPPKGLELIVGAYGICRAITSFEQLQGSREREACSRVLVRSLYRELVHNVKHAIAEREGAAPEVERLTELMAGREWLFENHGHHIDTSHLVSVLRYALELSDAGTLEAALEMAEYGTHLSSLFQHRGIPPFDEVYRDHAVYLRALLGREVDAAVAHFRAKLNSGGEPGAVAAPAQVLVGLLLRLDRPQEAAQVAMEHLRDAPPEELSCPTTLQLCELAGDRERLAALAREKGDLLAYAAAVIAHGDRTA